MKKILQMALLWLALALTGAVHAADFPAAKFLFESCKAESEDGDEFLHGGFS